MGQRILLCCCRKLCQTADGNTESEYLFIFYQTDMPQRKQRPGVQIALFPAFWAQDSQSRQPSAGSR